MSFLHWLPSLRKVAPHESHVQAVGSLYVRLPPHAEQPVGSVRMQAETPSASQTSASVSQSASSVVEKAASA